MFGVGLPEFAVIALVAAIFLGPERLPDLARQAGALLNKAKRFGEAARDELRDELGPAYSDLELRDLDPRTVVRKHIIEAMEEASETEARRTRDLQPLRAGQRAPYDDEAT